MNKEKMRKWTPVLLVALAVVTVGAVLGGNAVKSDPKSAARSEEMVWDTAKDEVVTEDICTLVQTFRYTPCGHQVTRRVSLPDHLVGAGFDAVQSAYPLWMIDTFSPENIVMRRDETMYCPMHLVLQADEAGRICVFKNVYGDGLACQAETPYLIGEFEKDVQHRLENGVAFDTREQLDAWVLLHAGA